MRRYSEAVHMIDCNNAGNQSYFGCKFSNFLFHVMYKNILIPNRKVKHKWNSADCQFSTKFAKSNEMQNL